MGTTDENITLMDPFLAPETTYCSSASKQTLSIGDLFCPNVHKLDALPTRHTLTLVSSPPDANT